MHFYTNSFIYFGFVECLLAVPWELKGFETSAGIYHRIAVISRRDWKKSFSDIQHEILDILAVQMSKRTTARRLVETGLHEKAARKKPLLTKIHRKRRVDFDHFHWCWILNQSKYVIWNYEKKNNHIGPDGWRYVRRSIKQEFKRRYVSRVWKCLSFNGVGPLYGINGILNKIF